MNQHDAVCAVKDLAIELGRSPTRGEFCTKYSGANYYLSACGGFSVLLKAAGLDTYRDRQQAQKQRITNAVFERDLEQHLEDYKPRAQSVIEPYARVLFIPDTHFPFAHQPTLEKIYRFSEKEKPEIIVQVGDLKDRYSHARFPRSHNIFTPDQEESLAHSHAVQMWSEVRKAAPKARCIQILGNHDIRPMKQILSEYPQAETWVLEGLKKSMTFDGVETIFDPRESLVLPGDVAVTHGHRTKIGEHRDEYLMNVVCGHQHVGGVVFRQIKGRVLWEMNCGLAGDPESKGLSYTPTKIVKWTLGWGFLDEYGPRFIPA